MNQSGSPSLARPKEQSTLAPAAIVVMSLYLAAQMISDIASLKIGIVAGLAVDMGTFLYPLTFTLRDMVHKALGKRTAQTLILSAGGINLLMALYLMWTTVVESDPAWGLGEAYAAVLSPVWRIVIASIIAEIVSELTDTEIFQRVWSAVRKRFGEKRQWLAVLASNAVSVPLDNVLFCTIAFAFSLPVEVIFQIFIVNLVAKFAMTLLSLPGIYLVPEKIRASVAGKRKKQTGNQIAEK